MHPQEPLKARSDEVPDLNTHTPNTNLVPPPSNSIMSVLCGTRLLELYGGAGEMRHPMTTVFQRVTVTVGSGFETQLTQILCIRESITERM